MRGSWEKGCFSAYSKRAGETVSMEGNHPDPEKEKWNLAFG